MAAIAAGAALQAAGGILAGLSAYQRARIAQKTLRFNARVAQRNADQAALALEHDALLADMRRSQEASALAFDLETFDRTADLAMGATRQAIGVSGTEFSGSNLVVAMHQAEELELQRSTIRFASLQRQADLEDQAAGLRFQAGQARQAGQFERGMLREQADMIGRGLPLTLTATALGVSSAIDWPRGKRRGTLTSRLPEPSRFEIAQADI